MERSVIGSCYAPDRKRGLWEDRRGSFIDPLLDARGQHAQHAFLRIGGDGVGDIFDVIKALSPSVVRAVTTELRLSPTAHAAS
jgi:hypothetical protein